MSMPSPLFGLGVLLLPLLAVVVLPAGLVIWGTLDAARTPGWVWRDARHRKAVWIAAQLVMLMLGTAAYALIVRPRLQDSQGR